MCLRSRLARTGDAGLCTARVSLDLFRDSGWGLRYINRLPISIRLFGTLRLGLPYCLKLASFPTRKLFIMRSWDPMWSAGAFSAS